MTVDEAENTLNADRASETETRKVFDNTLKVMVTPEQVEGFSLQLQRLVNDPAVFQRLGAEVEFLLSFRG